MIEVQGRWGTDERLVYADESAGFFLVREIAPVKVIARFTVKGEPVSKARARFTKRGSKTLTYTPERTTEAEQRIAWAFRQATPGHGVDADNTFGVMAVFFHATRQRRDVDNMLKLICDGLNGVAWADDSQVIEVGGRKAYAPLKEWARTDVLIYRTGIIERSTKPCEHCGAPILVYHSTADRKYCSKDCAYDARRKPGDERAPRHRTWPARPCLYCGKNFEPTYARARWCSRSCLSLSKTDEVVCAVCEKAFRMPQSWARQRVRHFCSDECRAVMAAAQADTCVRGHLKAEFYVRTAKGKAYCRECSRLRFPKIAGQP